MKTTQRPSLYTKKTIMHYVPSALEALPSLDGLRCENTDKTSRLRSSAVSAATQNVGAALYEILGMAELMRVAHEKGDLMSVQARLALLIAEAMHLASSVSNVLELIRLETGIDNSVCEHFDVAALLREVSQEARLLIGNKPVTVMDAPCPGPVLIYSDSSKIRKIMVGLMSNAAKFTDRGRIALILNRNDTGIRLTVTDTGRGITAEQINVMNDPAELNGFSASGLGIRIVKNLVSLLGGGLTISSKQGEGTIAEVSLPLSEKPRGLPDRWKQEDEEKDVFNHEKNCQEIPASGISPAA